MANQQITFEHALLTLTYNGLLLGLSWLGRRRIERLAPIRAIDLLILSLGTYRLARLVAYDKVTDWLRRPFVEGEPQSLGPGEERESPRRGALAPFAEIATNPTSAAMWIGQFAYHGLWLAPWLTRPLLTVAAVGEAAQLLDPLLALARRVGQPASLESASRAIRVER